jgi:hypothetical protein
MKISIKYTSNYCNTSYILKLDDTIKSNVIIKLETIKLNNDIKICTYVNNFIMKLLNYVIRLLIYNIIA